jgi:hypothetical protein
MYAKDLDPFAAQTQLNIYPVQYTQIVITIDKTSGVLFTLPISKAETFPPSATLARISKLIIKEINFLS